MDVKIRAKTEKGIDALKALIKDGKKLGMRTIGKYKIVKEEPMTVSIIPRALSKLPNKVLSIPGVQTTVNTAVEEMMRGYNCSFRDYEVLY